jgi:hypothetical protein
MAIIIISILWASLLLISWSGATPASDESATVAITSNPS